MVKCPNKNHPEWKELERLLPNQAYVVWDAFPHGIDKAPNGADSKLFKDLLEHYEGDRDSAIKAKAKTVTNAFKTWFGDWTKVSKVKYDTLSESDIVFGHPGIGKTYSFENGKFKDKFIDWDVEYNSKRDKWIEEHSGTKKGTAEYKKARNEYLIYPERHSDYVEFLTNEWNRVKEKAKKEGKILFASPHTLLKLFPQDFTRIINLSDEDFIKRDINRGGKRIESRLWKNAINDTISGIKNIPIDTLQEGEYLEDYLSSNKESKPAQSNAVEKAKEEYIQEMKGILAKAPRDSQGRLLAPNGKLSNLTERQYAQVRTKAFKDWFGDWEKANTFNIDTIDTSKVDIEEYDKPWKNVPTKSNKTLRIYIKGQHEKGYFELVKDQEFGIFSIHFKTGNANTGEIYGSTKEERSILYKQLLNALPNGAQLSTWGELSEGGIKALNKLGKNLKKVGERQVKDRQGNSISIPIYQKGEGVSKVVDENGEPLVVYHGTKNNVEISKVDFSKSDDLISFFTTNDKYHTANSYTESGINTGNSNLDTIVENIIEYDGVVDYIKVKKYIETTIHNSEVSLNDLGPFDDERSLKEIIHKNKELLRYLESNKDKLNFSENTANIYSFFESIKKPLVIDVKDKNWNEIKFEDNTFSTREIAKIANERGYDGVIFKNIRDLGAGMSFDGAFFENEVKHQNVYISFKSNQIKSIDNTGEFGETGNIFYKIMESVNKAEKELFNDRSIYNQRFYEKFKTFTDSSSAIKFLLDNGYIQEEYVKLAELLMAHSVKLSISKDFVNNGKLGSYIPGMKKGESSIELTKDTFTKRPDITAEVLLHEVMHHYLGYRYDMDAEFKKRVDMLHKKYTSLATENEKKSFYGLSEGKEEFLIEAVTNSELRNWMQRKDKELESSLYNRLKRLIAKALLLLGVHNANAYNLNDITGAITHMVENISKREAPLSERKYSKSEAIRRFGGLDINHVQNKKDSDYIRTMEQEAGVTRVRIEQGIKSRIKAFEQYGKATYNQVRVMEQELANLQELWQKNEDKEAMIRFINHAAREADKPIRAIDAAFEEYKATGKFSLRNNQLVQIYRDFIGFYEPVIENINEKLFTIGYFDDLSDTEYEFLGNSIGAVTQDFSRIKSKYSALLANRFGDIIIEAAKEYKMDEAVIRAYVQDHKNYTSEDISWFHTYVGDMKVTKDKTLNLIARKIADLKNEIDRQTVSKASEVLPVFQAVSGSKWQLLYEKDDKGKKTGYLVRDRKYGKFYAERDAYFDSLGEAPIGDKEALREWYAKRNEWLKEHSERRYKPEYYDLFNNMSFAAREARDKIQFEISSMLSKYMDLKGNVHVERISEDDWNKLQVMYQEKRRLSNTYNNDGSKKTGIDLDIAEELQVINEELNKNLSYKSNKERFEKVRAEKEASLSKEDYDRWYKRSTRWAYTEEFQKLLDSIDKRDYGLENPLYAELNEEKKELTKMYRNTHDFMINTKLMPESVKKRIVEIDNILEEIRSKAERRKKEGLTFDKIAKIVYSNYYYAEKQHAIDMDEKNPGYYEKWRNESHTINKKGKLVPHSYYNLMIPNDSKHMEFVPSREFTEIDPESPYWNDQYDINNPEPYQPKKSLYDNSEAYNKVMNDPKLKAIHEVVVNTMAEANEKISFLKRGNNYKLPQITGGAWAFIKANRGIVKGMNRFVRDKYFEDRDDDVDFNYQSYAPDGQPLDTIPTHYMRMLDDPSTITSNLAGALMAYYNMAVNFEKKQQVLPEVKIVQNQVRTRQVQPNWLESKLDRYTTYTPNTQSRASKRLDRFLETNIFGNKYNSIRVGKFNIVKALVGLKNYATLVNLGANIFVAAANVMGSAHQHFTEALTGVYYTPRTALIALRNSLYHMSSMLLHAGKTTHSDKLLSLMNMNQIARENSNMYKRLNYNRFARFLMNHLWYGMMTAGDVFTKGQILTSVYLNTKYVPEHDRFMMRDEYLMLHRDDKKAGKKFSKLNTMNLYDMYEASGINAVLKTGEKYERYHKYITPDLTNRVTNVTRYLAQRADGMMDDSSRNFAQANAVTGFVFMHKNFILSAVEDRVIKATEYNFMLERVDEAQYRTVARRIKETVKYLWQFNKYYYYVFRKRAGVEKPTLRKTEFYENYNMKRVKIESSLVIAYMFISMLLNSYRGDDDKWWMQAIKYAHDRATYEAGNLYNPMDLFNTFKALSPAASSLENAKTVALAITALLDSDSNIFKETKYGPYSGFRRITKAAFKTTPLKNVIEATDPKSKHKYLKGQLQ